MKRKKILSYSPEETIDLGRVFARTLKLKDVIGLQGRLGSGKTQFVKGIACYFKVTDIVNSPSFLIINEYKGIDPVTKRDVNLNHFDFYRLDKKEELDVLGFEEFISDDSICIIEWCELAEEYLNAELKKVVFEYGKCENERIVKI